MPAFSSSRFCTYIGQAVYGKLSAKALPACLVSSTSVWRGLSTTLDQGVKEDHAPVKPGSVLCISAAKSSVEVKDCPVMTTTEHARVKATWPGANTPSPWLMEHLIRNKDTHLFAVTEKEEGHAGTLVANIPEKYINVEISSRGGSVKVDRVVEANLLVATLGGPVKLGTMRTYMARVDTTSPLTTSAEADGSVTATELSGSDITLTTLPGSPVTIKRLVGLRVNVKTQKGAVKAKAVYGEHINMHTGGGDVEIGMLHPRNTAIINSEGGNILVDGLDGHAELKSLGGDIEVHLQRDVGGVALHSAGGKVKLAICPTATTKVLVNSDANINSRHEFGTDEGTGARVAVFTTADEATRRFGQPTEGCVTIDAGPKGDVEIVSVNWMDAVRMRLETRSASSA